MPQKRYLSVERAMQNHDYDLLRSLASLGGIRTGQRRRAEAESRKRLAQLEAGTITKVPKTRKKRGTPVTTSSTTEVDERIEVVLEADWKKRLFDDARRHHMRNLAGASQR